MKKFRDIIIKILNGKNIKGFNLSPYDKQELIRIYNGMVRHKQPEFICGNVKEILDKCGIKTMQVGVGWKVV